MTKRETSSRLSLLSVTAFFAIAACEKEPSRQPGPGGEIVSVGMAQESWTEKSRLLCDTFCEELAECHIYGSVDDPWDEHDVEPFIALEMKLCQKECYWYMRNGTAVRERECGDFNQECEWWGPRRDVGWVGPEILYYYFQCVYDIGGYQCRSTYQPIIGTEEGCEELEECRELIELDYGPGVHFLVYDFSEGTIEDCRNDFPDGEIEHSLSFPFEPMLGILPGDDY